MPALHPPPAVADRAAEHRFFRTMALVSAATICIGFAQTYSGTLARGTATVPVMVHVHAAVFTAWLMIFVAQTLLVSARRTDLHRRLGPAAVAFALLMLVVGIRTAADVARVGHLGIPGVMFDTVDGFLFLNVASVVVFALLVLAGWARRRDPAAHKRFMLMATTIALAPPGLSRFPFIAGHVPLVAVGVLAFVLAGPAWDLLTTRRLHAAYRLGLPLTLLILPPVVAALASTPAWHQVTLWLIR